ncbi:hypothetical protein [Mariniblastus fucicola]|uniref:Uncharacterized protein n=1 Tax=Mariniblastus fucicola TaxID=980251 RepID=A0A5B9PFI6_9BACT|nr:hypothetical protein [Mariniblastus fucicola]QEG23396.1 hypothetical protein MFFC18_32940 [Mariniblastus fucicola]
MNHPTQNSAFSSTRIDPSAMLHSRVRVGRDANHSKEATVKLNKNGSTIESIHITCACGEEIVVNCIYPDDQS